MKMELFFLVSTYKNCMNENPDEELARYVAGPFGSWDDAAVQRQKHSQLSFAKLEIVTQNIEVVI